jgi:hypothetical protein
MICCWAGYACLLCCLAGPLLCGFTLETPTYALSVRVRNRSLFGWQIGDGYLGSRVARIALRDDHVLELQVPLSPQGQRRLRLPPLPGGDYDWPSTSWLLAHAQENIGLERVLIMCEDHVRTYEVVHAADLAAGLRLGPGLDPVDIAWDDGPLPPE